MDFIHIPNYLKYIFTEEELKDISPTAQFNANSDAFKLAYQALQNEEEVDWSKFSKVKYLNTGESPPRK